MHIIWIGWLYVVLMFALGQRKRGEGGKEKISGVNGLVWPAPSLAC
ncbi:hypothetical protein [Aquaspirillum sp. LM1]|nr:hypothetical protein [Aquaspirillum sp. LM1]